MARADRQTLLKSRPAMFSVEGLAERALATIKAGALLDEDHHRRSEMDDLLRSLINRDDTAYQNLILQRIASGETTDALIDWTIPSLARSLGEGWMTDSLSFADVTIGSSRLQQTVRSLGARYEVDCLNPTADKRALLISPEPEQHTLGIFIAANQLRRQGIWVQLALDLKINQIDSLVKSQNFAMIGLSLGTEHSINLAQKMIEAIRTKAGDTPIVISGSAIAGISDQTATQLGADFTATTASEALDLCDIDTARQNALPLEFVTS